MAAELMSSGAGDAPVLVLAHGAGAPMDSDWMERMTGLLVDRGVRVVRFEFPYMAGRRAGVRRPAPKAETLMDDYREVVAEVAAASSSPVVIGGKSMGGRVATMVADELRDAGSVSAVVCFGYPFHPPGAPGKLRTAHLETLRTPTLICQGTRDPFGTEVEVGGYTLSDSIELRFLPDGEHELKPRAKISGRTHAQNLAEAADRAADFTRTARSGNPTP
ncbi:alpha/beta fold hydrolase [Herbiconiux sp. L3-i23]|uniref:alpha/beta fold hydrolase n=1 Tax=Herbiconiux sp. L3-i23 TaxID=2905871 RepID=UPI002069B3CD|nr:alpha/beta fold hydrolase [Herbiconiux sp. L3-i23]BDI23853.1 hydrolase [Herbiconiux sp. L3-i23]